MIKLSGKIEHKCYVRFLKRHFPEVYNDSDRMDSYLHQKNVLEYYDLIGVHCEHVRSMISNTRYMDNLNCIMFSVWLLHNKDYVDFTYL